MKTFPKVVGTCPHCGDGSIKKRRGFHLLARWRCTKCRGTFFNPLKQKQLKAVATKHTFEKKVTVEKKGFGKKKKGFGGKK
ncbi:MAG: zf-TFIIB domain-containing protein [Dehalococcoidia bacterium]|nr:zf-TFIIB domain-containing protein [Dehalococcoidia bacterium]